MRSEWETKIACEKKYPTYAMFIEFIQAKVKMLEVMAQKKKDTSSETSEMKSKIHSAVTSNTPCILCKKGATDYIGVKNFGPCRRINGSNL